MVIIERYISKLMFSNMYVVKESGHALIIDPHERFDMMDDITPDLILLTHEHYDHISGVNAWKERYHIPVLCSSACAMALENNKQNMAHYFVAFSEMQTYGVQDPDVPIDDQYTCHGDLTFDDTVELHWQGHKMRLFSLPGHSKGSIGIMIDESFLFSGDSLLPDRKVELRFPGGSRKLWESISVQRLKALSEDLTVYPGHRDVFVLKDRENNGDI